MISSQDWLDDAQCDATVRELRWPDGVKGPQGGSAELTKRGHDARQPDRQRDEGQGCGRPFDDLSEPILEGPPQPWRVWIGGLYRMGLHRSNQPIAADLALDTGTVQAMTPPLPEGLALKKSAPS
jgi:hypothetical protein